MTTTNNLSDIFTRNLGKASDKWEQYIQVYQYELAPMIAAGRPLRLLEIGVQNGGSLEAWQEFLPPGSQVQGLDIDPTIASLTFTTDNIRADVADATSEIQLGQVLGTAMFDVIIDDGSHVCHDVRRSFELLFRRLTPGGLYIIEDLHCSYWPQYGGGLRSTDSSIEHLKRLIDDMHADHYSSDGIDMNERRGVKDRNRVLAKVAFYDSIAVIGKLPFEKTEPYRRVLAGEATLVQPASNWVHLVSTQGLGSLRLSDSAAKQVEQSILTELDQRRSEVVCLVDAVAALTAELATVKALLKEHQQEVDPTDVSPVCLETQASPMPLKISAQD